MTWLRALAPAALAALLGSAAPTDAAAQEIAGTALDASGQPIPGVPVALHRVGGGGGGATVAAMTTEPDGSFRFVIEAVDSAVYFVAMRHDDRMYIGPPARGGVERVTGYEMRADPANEAGAVASALSGGEAGPLGPAAARQPGAMPGGGAGAVWFVGILALVVAAIFVTTAPGYRRRRRREMLMELAGIENRLAVAGPDTDTAAETRRRDALRERLTPRG